MCACACFLTWPEFQAKETERTSRNNLIPGPRPGLLPRQTDPERGGRSQDGRVGAKRCGSGRLWPCCPLGSASQTAGGQSWRSNLSDLSDSEYFRPGLSVTCSLGPTAYRAKGRLPVHPFEEGAGLGQGHWKSLFFLRSSPTSPSSPLGSSFPETPTAKA